MEQTGEEHRVGVSGRSPWLRLGIVACAGAYAIVCGAVTLVGWFFHMPRLTDWAGNNISMFANTAICSMSCGLGLLLLWGREPGAVKRIAAAALGFITVTIGVLTLFQHVTGVDLGIDSLVVLRDWGQGAAASPMRMGPPASMSFSALGLSILLLASGRAGARRWASALGLFCGAIAGLSLIGHLYGADWLYSLPRLTSISMQSATAVLAVSMGVIGLVPEWGLGELMSRRDAGGMLARRFLPAFTLVAVGLGWVRLYGQELGLFDTAFGTAVRTLLEMAFFGSLLWWTANGLSRAEGKLRENRAELRATLDDAMRSARFKDEFLATLSHELRNPMTAILGWIGILRSDTAGSADVKLEHGLQVIERSARLQAEMIDDLLDVSRIASGIERLNIQNTETREVVRSAVDVVRPSAEAKGISIQTFFSSGAMRMKADPARLQQVLFNLLSNAVKFTPPGGTVRIHCGRVGSSVEISVSDTGMGITPEFLPYVFDRFRQQDVATTKRFGGLGLGLAIARQLVGLHGGEVIAESEGAGKGSRFTIRLPVAAFGATPVRRGERGIESMPLPDLRGRRILVVENDPDIRELLNRMLLARGASVDAVGSSEEALARVEASGSPDAIVCDIGMPGEDGYQLIRRLRDGGFTARAVAVTAFARSADRARALHAGFDAHVSKPIRADDLFAAIES